MSLVLDGANVVLNLGNVLILGTKIETDLAEGCLKRFEFRVSENGGDAKSPTMVDLDDTGESSSHGGDLMVHQGLDGAKV